MLGLLEPEVLELLDASAQNRQCVLDQVVSDRLGTNAADLPIGRFDAALATLRINSFGPHVQVRATCTECEEQLEAELNLADLPLGSSVPPVLRVPIEGETRQIRMPTVTDLRAAAASSDPRRELIERCLIDPALHDGEAVLDDEALELVEDALEDADPMIDVRLALQCPACDAHMSTRLDIATHLWREIENYGTRLVLEVHWLASRYGWTEQDVLALSPNRRRTYLELVS